MTFQLTSSAEAGELLKPFHATGQRKRNPGTNLARLALILVALLWVGLSWSQAYPSKMIALVVPFPAGGAADGSARAMQPLIQKLLGQTVIVDNLVGASGAVGVQRLLADPADGYRLLVGSPSETIVTPLANTNAKYAGSDLRLAGIFGISHMVLVARPGLPVSNIDELIAFARNPANKQLSYGSVGYGSLFHIVAEDFLQHAGIKMLHVPYKGMAPLLTDVIGEVVDVSFMPFAGNVVDMARTGRIKALAVTSGERSKQLPAVPTFKESKTMGNFEYSFWTGVLVRKDTPEPVVARLNTTVNEMLKDPAFRKYVEETGSIVAQPMTAVQASAFYQADVARYQALAKTIQLKPE